MTVTDRQRRILAAIARGLNGHSGADEIAGRIGYRPARSGRLAVSAMLRRMVDPETGCGPFVVRLPPADRWGHATWCITDAGRAAIAPPAVTAREAPSYHDLHVRAAPLSGGRKPLSSLPFGYQVTCTRVGGWELWLHDMLIASEYGGRHKWLVLDVGGHVICDGRAAAAEASP